MYLFIYLFHINLTCFHVSFCSGYCFSWYMFYLYFFKVAHDAKIILSVLLYLVREKLYQIYKLLVQIHHIKSKFVFFWSWWYLSIYTDRMSPTVGEKPYACWFCVSGISVHLELKHFSIIIICVTVNNDMYTVTRLKQQL